MEHRYGRRFHTDHKTLIIKNGMPVAIGRIHNFSRAGVFVKTDFDLVGIDQPLEFELIARNGGRCYGERRVCKAFVMHKAGGGVGLLLREDCVETQKYFATFVADELSRRYADIDPRSIVAAARPIEPTSSRSARNRYFTGDFFSDQARQFSRNEERQG